MERLDRLMVLRGMSSTRARAARDIEACGVRVNGTVQRKPGKWVPSDAELAWESAPMPWVSRGALKLLGAWEVWPELVPVGAWMLDVGASTGGFTEVALAHGALGVVAVDAGSDQLAPALRSDGRVRWFDKTQIQSLRREDITALGVPLPAYCAVDVSFVSATMVLGSVESLMAPDSPAHGVVLVKPQFEVGPQGLGRNGVVRDARLRQQALDQVVAAAREVGFVAVDWVPSPVTGGDGNAEWLLRLHRPL